MSFKVGYIHFISKKILKLLEENLKNEEDKKCASKILKGNKLQYMEANWFVQALLSAMSFEDCEEYPQIKITNDNLNDILSDIPSQLPPFEALSLSQGTSADAEFLLQDL